MESDSLVQRHAELLYRRVHKTFRHFRKRFERQEIGCFRLYDWTIPEVRARVDYYEGHVVVAEYVRQQTMGVPGYLEALGDAAARAVGAEAGQIHLKRRNTRKDGSARHRYERLGEGGSRTAVREREFKFWVNLDDYIDTGLFADHRETRTLLAAGAEGRSLLNLYCYTGSLTVAAALGGAASSVSVDLSRGYLNWAEDNLELNRAASDRHTFVLADCESFLQEALSAGKKWDIVVVDPPSFSTVGSFDSRRQEFDVQEAHPRLLKMALGCLQPDGCLLFSTNHQRFVPNFADLGENVHEITSKTVPEDFRHRGPFQPGPVHRCFLLRGHL